MTQIKPWQKVSCKARQNQGVRAKLLPSFKLNAGFHIMAPIPWNRDVSWQSRSLLHHSERSGRLHGSQAKRPNLPNWWLTMNQLIILSEELSRQFLTNTTKGKATLRVMISAWNRRSSVCHHDLKNDSQNENKPVLDRRRNCVPIATNLHLGAVIWKWNYASCMCTFTSIYFLGWIK